MQQQPETCIIYSEPPKTSQPKPKPKHVVLKFGEKPKVVSKPKDNNDDDTPKIRTVKQEVSAQIRNDRVALGWKQQELANKAQVPIAAITEYENGKAIHNQGEYQKIRKALDAGKIAMAKTA
jgi:ribosome-binding protein aMBF1 (putative translation factor)